MVELMLQCYDRHTGYIVYPVSFSIDGRVVGVNTGGNLVFATVSVGTHEFYAEPPTGYRVICWRIDGPPDISGNPVRLGVLSTSSTVGVYVEKEKPPPPTAAIAASAIAFATALALIYLGAK